MSVRAALAVAAAALLALPGAGGAAAEPLLAVAWDGTRWHLERVDPTDLRRIGGSLVLPAPPFQGWAASPGGGRVALGAWSRPELRVVDANSLRLLRHIRLGGDRYVQHVSWIGPSRLLALVGSCCRPDARLAVVDVDRGRVIRERALSGAVQEVESIPGGLVLLLAPNGSIGPARLAVADRAARVRIAPLGRIRAGFRRLRGDGYRGRTRRPGLTLDPDGRRAFVVGAGEPVAEIDLESLRVSYHAPARSLQSSAKNVTGPFRAAAWLGEGRIAVTGFDHRGTRLHVTGLELLETRGWSMRTLDERVSHVVVSQGTVLARVPGELIAFGAAGTERFRLRGAFEAVQPAAGRAYVWEHGGDVLVVELATGAVVARAARRSLSLLGT